MVPRWAAEWFSPWDHDILWGIFYATNVWAKQAFKSVCSRVRNARCAPSHALSMANGRKCALRGAKD